MELAWSLALIEKRERERERESVILSMLYTYSCLKSSMGTVMKDGWTDGCIVFAASNRNEQG